MSEPKIEVGQIWICKQDGRRVRVVEVNDSILTEPAGVKLHSRKSRSSVNVFPHRYKLEKPSA